MSPRVWAWVAASAEDSPPTPRRRTEWSPRFGGRWAVAQAWRVGWHAWVRGGVTRGGGLGAGPGSPPRGWGPPWPPGAGCTGHHAQVRRGSARRAHDRRFGDRPLDGRSGERMLGARRHTTNRVSTTPPATTASPIRRACLFWRREVCGGVIKGLSGVPAWLLPFPGGTGVWSWESRGRPLHCTSSTTIPRRFAVVALLRRTSFSSWRPWTENPPR